MRLLFVHNYPIWDARAGGGQRANHEVATAAAQAGHETWVLHLSSATHEGVQPTLYSVVVVPDRGRLVWNALAVAAAARRWAIASPGGVVLASAPEGGLIADGAPSGTGIVATCHHPDPPPLPRLRWGRRPLWSLASLRSYQSHFLQARLLRGAHVRTVPSSWSRDALYERGYLDRSLTVEVVPNGVAPEWFTQSDLARVPEVDILFVGRLDGQKGVDVLLRALARPELRHATARFVGTGPAGEVYSALAADLGIAGRVRFDGFREAAQVRAAAGSARVLVLPSRAESFGMVILEAMAAGLPVVATAVGGVPEFARHAVNALLVPAEDEAALAAATRRLLDDPDLRRTLINGGRATASRLTWSSVTARYLELAAQAAERALLEG